MNYKHTQIGWLMLISFGLLVTLCAVVPLSEPGQRELILCTALIVTALVLILVGTLTVEVDIIKVRLRFGIGLIRKGFLLEDIESCRTVKNKWWWGWGIKWMPNGWLFNVSGLDAVELKMKDGRYYRIGTDDPKRLAETIRLLLGGNALSRTQTFADEFD